MYYTEEVLGNIAEAICSLLRICIESSHASLQKSLTSNNDNECSMRWWHSWLARAKIAKVNDAWSCRTSCCLGAVIEPSIVQDVETLTSNC